MTEASWPPIPMPSSIQPWSPPPTTEAVLLATIQELTATIRQLTAELAGLKRAGYEAPPPSAQVILPEPLPTAVVDAIQARANTRDARVYLEQYAARRMRETEGDGDVVAKEILEGDEL